MIRINIPMLVEPLVLDNLVQLAQREGRSASEQARILITEGILADLRRQVEADEAAADAAAAAARPAAEVH